MRKLIDASSFLVVVGVCASAPGAEAWPSFGTLKTGTTHDGHGPVNAGRTF
jgi:hypothetical protein